MAIPDPPPAPRQNRYPVRMLHTAREMYADGDSWTPTQIQRYLAEHFDGPTPHVNTIRCWVIPGEADAQRRSNSATQRTRILERQGAPRLSTGELGPQQLTDRMLLLRRAGLSYSAIGIVVEMYHAITLTEDQIRTRLQKQGVPKSAARSEAVRRAWVDNHYGRPAATAS